MPHVLCSNLCFISPGCYVLCSTRLVHLMCINPLGPSIFFSIFLSRDSYILSFNFSLSDELCHVINVKCFIIKKGSYCSIFKTARMQHYMLYLYLDNITVLSQNFNNSALVWLKQKIDRLFRIMVVIF